MAFDRARIGWWPPTRLTRWWLPHAFFGDDEWYNPSLVVVVPPFGGLIIFYGRRFDRTTWFLFAGTGDHAHYMSPDFREVAMIRMPPGWVFYDMPTTLPERAALASAEQIELSHTPASLPAGDQPT